MESSLKLIPSLKVAQDFLDMFEPNGDFTFLAISENPLFGKSAVEFHGTLLHHAAKLAMLNNAGCGIFVMINEGDGKGRKTHNVVHIRANFVDLDCAPMKQLFDAPLPPHIITETSPGKGHGYWLTSDCLLSEFKPRQQALAARFGGDKSVCDLPRVMRLPGFYHVKTDTPFQTRLLKPVL
jgi:hypothetical protein